MVSILKITSNPIFFSRRCTGNNLKEKQLDDGNHLSKYPWRRGEDKKLSAEK